MYRTVSLNKPGVKTNPTKPRTWAGIIWVCLPQTVRKVIIEVC